MPVAKWGKPHSTYSDVANITFVSCLLLLLCCVHAVGDLAAVHELVYPALTKWYNIGLQLKLPAYALDAIERSRGDDGDHLRDTLNLWLKRDAPTPTVKTLVAVLKSSPVGESRLANDVQQSVQSARDMPTGHVIPKNESGGTGNAELVMDPNIKVKEETVPGRFPDGIGADSPIRVPLQADVDGNPGQIFERNPALSRSASCSSEEVSESELTIGNVSALKKAVKKKQRHSDVCELEIQKLQAELNNYRSVQYLDPANSKDHCKLLQGIITLYIVLYSFGSACSCRNTISVFEGI